MFSSLVYQQRLVGATFTVYEYPNKKEPIMNTKQTDEFSLRGLLASELKCWHRLTEDEAQNLVDFVRNMPAKPAQQQEPVAWHGYDLDGMVEAFDRVIEVHYNSKQPFHSPVDSDARMALRILRGFIPSMKRYTSPPASKPLTEVQIATVYWGATGQSLRPQDNALAHKFASAIEAAHKIGVEK